jgi:hypothetical protein
MIGVETFVTGDLGPEQSRVFWLCCENEKEKGDRSTRHESSMVDVR